MSGAFRDLLCGGKTLYARRIQRGTGWRTLGLAGKCSVCMCSTAEGDKKAKHKIQESCVCIEANGSESLLLSVITGLWVTFLV